MPRDTTGVLPLARKAQAGDEAALDELFRRFQEPLRRMVSIRLGAHIRSAGALESMDIVQQTFLKANSKIGTFEVRSERSVLSWLAKIAERQIFDASDKALAGKRDWRRSIRLDDLLHANDSSSGGFDPASGETGPGDRAERNEVQRIVDAAVEELSDEYREVILERDFAKADWESVAAAIGAVNVRAAQARHYRARARLASILGRRLPSDSVG